MQNSVGQRNWCGVGGNKGVSRTRSALGLGCRGGGGTEAGFQSPHWALSESQEKYLRLRVKELICGSLSGVRIRQFLPQPCTPWTGMQVLWEVQRLGHGVQGLWSNPRVRAAVQYGEMDRGDVREETGGKCLWRKVRQPWKQGDIAESHIEGGAITIASLSPQASIGS